MTVAFVLEVEAHSVSVCSDSGALLLLLLLGSRSVFSISVNQLLVYSHVSVSITVSET